MTDRPETADFDPTAPIAPSRALTPHAVRVNATLVRRGFWPKMRRVAAKVPFAEDAVALYYAARDPLVPWRTKGMILAALAYFVLPTDFIPDFIPGLGFTDDAAVIAAAIGMARGALRDNHREAARAWLDRFVGEP